MNFQVNNNILYANGKMAENKAQVVKRESGESLEEKGENGA